MTPWQAGEPVEIGRPDGMGWVRVVSRVILIAVTIFGLMLPMFLARAMRLKMVSENMVRLACILCLRIIGISLQVEGKPMPHAGAVVANHSTWMDIFVLNAVQRAYFVSKVEVQNWPVVGFIARAAGTVFIARRAQEAAKQKTVFLDRITQGDKLLFFPEGTSTDGRRVLKFRSSLFAAFFDENLRDKMWIQPASVCYVAPKGQDETFYGWWGDMDFAPHFLFVLSAKQQGKVVVRFAEPIRVADATDRKTLAMDCEQKTRAGLLL